jgi:hypothetical protein
VYPHSSLLKFWPPTKDGYTLYYASLVYRVKRVITRVAQICAITQMAKIDALYCMYHASNEAYKIFPTLNNPHMNYTEIRQLRRQVLSPLTTTQLQHMVPTCIRLVFKAAELMDEWCRGSRLPISIYGRYNGYLVAHGPELLVALEERTLEERWTYLDMVKRPRRMTFPLMHEELIYFLESRGQGLMTDPGIEIQQFFASEDTILDMRESDEEDD